MMNMESRAGLKFFLENTVSGVTPPTSVVENATMGINCGETNLPIPDHVLGDLNPQFLILQMKKISKITIS